MENKYFTPDIEDMSVGCEYELYHQEDGWKKVIFSAWENFNYDAFIYCLKDKEVRVPYLTKEQIEAEGYSLTAMNKGKYIKYSGGDLHIYDHNGDTSYLGECKDINTFRKIIKLLKI
jgi:hypothetical protein